MRIHGEGSETEVTDKAPASFTSSASFMAPALALSALNPGLGGRVGEVFRTQGNSSLCHHRQQQQQ